MLQHRRNAGGFTLVEILAVVVILGIASAVIIPQIGTRDDLTAAAAARIVIADLTYAQNRAIATQKMQYVKFDVDASPQNYAIRNSTTLSDYVTDPITKENFVRTLGSSRTPGLENITFDADATSFDGQQTVAFDSLGQPWAVGSGAPVIMTSGAIRILSGTYSMTVTIEPYTGEMKVQ